MEARNAETETDGKIAHACVRCARMAIVSVVNGVMEAQVDMRMKCEMVRHACLVVAVCWRQTKDGLKDATDNLHSTRRREHLRTSGDPMPREGTSPYLQTKPEQN